MNIYVYEEPILRKKSTEIEEFDVELSETLDEMVRTMDLANGVGLAANQVGLDKRFFVLHIEDEIYKVVNPEIVEFGSEEIEMEEGCLSIPGIFRNVVRPRIIKVKYKDEKGNEVTKELDGLASRAFQHELDHLDGVLFIDRISPMSKNLIRKKLQLMNKNRKPRVF